MPLVVAEIQPLVVEEVQPRGPSMQRGLGAAVRLVEAPPLAGRCPPGPHFQG